MTRHATTIAAGLIFPESPRWHGGRLWLSDFYQHGVFSVAPEGGDLARELTLETQPSGLGWDAAGDLVVVSMTDQRLLVRRGGRLETLADLSPFHGFWSNDLVVGATGVSYVGSFGFDLDATLRDVGIEGLLANPIPTTHLVVVAPDGQVLQTVPDMVFPNGSVLTPDGRTLIVAETLAARLSAFDVDDSGRLSNRRVWAELALVAPDGICLDAEGAVWVANALDATAVRVREGGEVVDTVAASQRVFACALGGEGRRTLYLCTAPTSDRFALVGTDAGRIESCAVDVGGAGRP